MGCHGIWRYAHEAPFLKKALYEPRPAKGHPFANQGRMNAAHAEADMHSKVGGGHIGREGREPFAPSNPSRLVRVG
ncbi:hypothetical protein GCM10016234_34270 [Tianweitania populi]|uniref:Uncharacterized protein n=1 Tax=Tianweitania populi TaxID=1607949 RepID=A0A8J3DX15_9HYPH|nr:hypothetical protein GCM10016234_34270 [Tianweitania populi]